MDVQANSQLFRLRFNDEKAKKEAISSELAGRILKIAKLKDRYESFPTIWNGQQDTVLAQAHQVIQVFFAPSTTLRIFTYAR